MIRISNIKLSPQGGESELKAAVCKRLSISEKEIRSLRVVKRSVDARKKPQIFVIYTVEVSLHRTETPYLRLPNVQKAKEATYHYPRVSLAERPVVVGFGPAGMFAALFLAECGTRPLVLERGADVDVRTKMVEQFWTTGQLSEQTNVQFGEGGAGTFSDGKLTTGIRDPLCQHILRELVRFGAPEQILYEHRPHIGTDRLAQVVKRIRERIIALGGTVEFLNPLTGLIIEQGVLRGIRTAKQTEGFAVSNLVLAIGHSARDTFSLLKRHGVLLQPKPFAVGLRIEHLQREIDQSQYGGRVAALGAADYKLVTRLSDGQGVFTFCMCPGGQVVASSSEEGGVVTNGMSRFARDGENANSAVLVGVNPPDGIAFQRQLEQAAFRLGGGGYRAPAQLVGDFLQQKPSRQAGDIQPSYRPGVTFCDLRECLPGELAAALREGIAGLDRKLHGFARYDAVLTGVESRTSSPVRIVRGADYQSSSLAGLYPCGEGAGYAGGILSAAVDGMHAAEHVCKQSILME